MDHPSGNCLAGCCINTKLCSFPPGTKPALSVRVADRKFMAVLPLPVRSHIICITKGRLHIKMGNICASCLACTTSGKTWN